NTPMICSSENLKRFICPSFLQGRTLITVGGKSGGHVKNNMTQLVKVSRAVDDFKPMLAELIAAEERLRETGNHLNSLTGNLDTLSEKINSIETTLGLIFDKVDQRGDPSSHSTAKPIASKLDRRKMFNQMQSKFGSVVEALEKRFGWVDKRSVGSTAYRFTHGNRKDRLSPEAADEISRIHSSWKSYLRRHQDLDSWLDEESYENFVNSADRAISMINIDPSNS
ncbi:MAG: hypothetical protein ACREB7_14845, partial [Sphingopyxis sp.]|uniref:hypothetical protein n=1 Tax=Sphingopyxis sp. TaxID=1908224 RepID=UPI003D6C8026